jgi:PBP1b-binding outer membrane lipoprotein LpoB
MKSPTALFSILLATLLLSGCSSDNYDPVYAEKAIREMLAHGSKVPLATDLPKTGDSDWCERINLAIDNPKLTQADKASYIQLGREKHCERALAAQ